MAIAPSVGFPDQTRVLLYFRERHPTAKIQVCELTGTGAERLSGEQRFRLRWNRGAHELRLMLRQQSGPTVFLERLEVQLRNDAQTGALILDRQAPLEVGFRLFQHGYHSWSSSMLRTAQEADVYARMRWKHDLDENPETPHQGRFGWLGGAWLPAKGRFHSEGIVGLEQTNSDNPFRMLLYTGAGGQQFVRFRVHLQKRTAALREFAVIWDFNGMKFGPHSRTALSPLIWQVEPGRASSKRTDFAEFFDEGMRTVGRKLEPRVSSARSPVGWCSWYYYYEKINEGIILTNLRILREARAKLDFFQIDDGWQNAIGDWLSVNSGFKNGMRFVAEQVTESGYKPGLWLAPFVVRPDAKLYRQEPDMVLKDHSGRPVRALYNPIWGGRTYALDVTHPRTLDYLANVVSTMTREWGYQFLKLDFLYAACYRGAYHDPKTTGAVRLRRALEVIRRAVPKQTFLLGCGCPLFPAVGLVDGMRIGMDTNQVWSGDLISKLLRDRNYPTLRSALINTITRSALHRRLWLNDPDCVMVRFNDTKLRPDQIQLQASVMALAGGLLLFSDDMSRLEPRSMKLLQRTLDLHRRCALEVPLPLGLLENHFPRGLYNPAGFLGIWNPTSRPQWVSLKLPPRLDRAALRQAKDYWTGMRIPWEVQDDRVELGMGPYESMVAELW